MPFLNDRSAAPERVTLADGRTRLILEWATGPATMLSAAMLRHECRCPECISARMSESFAPMLDDITIVALQSVGSSALNIGFSDGHSRGIYPWGALRMLDGAQPAAPVLATRMGL